ncbi:membrane protein insertion efficiency factor YidD [bacterium]|nr:membrane protein insertion efficiency factor YidD [bacterium]
MHQGGPRTGQSFAARTACLLIRGYQRFVGPVLPPTCRFTPSCSQYTLDAVRTWGFWKGLWLGCKRIAKCHPFHPGGHDPVP